MKTKATPYDRVKASRLRRRLARGKRPLNKADRAWLEAYDAAHPSSSRTIAEIETENAALFDATSAERAYPAPESRAETEPEVESAEESDAEPDDEPEKAPRDRVAEIEADLQGHGANMLVRAVEFNERVSVRALALLEQMADMLDASQTRLNETICALAESRAAAIESNAGVDEEDFVDDDPERNARLESMLMRAVGPALMKQFGHMLPQQSPGAPSKPAANPGQKRAP